MGVNIPENISEGNSFENAMKNSKSTGNTLRKTGELEEYRKLTIGVDNVINDEIRQNIIDTSPTISSDK
jgi:hypothetical protein